DMYMQVEDASGKRAQLEFTLQRKFTPGQTATFIKITAPREESDKAILALEKNDQATEATSYLAGLKKLAKLKSDNYVTFREAKVTIQELLGMELAQYDYGVVERAADNGVVLVKAEGKAKANRNLAYPRLVVFFSEDQQEPVRIEVFDDKNELVKRVAFDPLQTVQNKRMVSRVTFEDLTAKRKSVIETRSVKFNQNLSPKLFTEDNLKGIISSASAKLTK
ncbi:MAG: outer membrane lipoprotein-sorting protein, partial [Acidobacteria bacterium]|nr:outer membrane lipoprotein-sorting protein [Acidobacteriota bacterium]